MNYMAPDNPAGAKTVVRVVGMFGRLALPSEQLQMMSLMDDIAPLREWAAIVVWP